MVQSLNEVDLQTVMSEKVSLDEPVYKVAITYLDFFNRKSFTIIPSYKEKKCNLLLTLPWHKINYNHNKINVYCGFAIPQFCTILTLTIDHIALYKRSERVTLLFIIICTNYVAIGIHQQYDLYYL